MNAADFVMLGVAVLCIGYAYWRWVRPKLPPSAGHQPVVGAPAEHLYFVSFWHMDRGTWCPGWSHVSTSRPLSSPARLVSVQTEIERKLGFKPGRLCLSNITLINAAWTGRETLSE